MAGPSGGMMASHSSFMLGTREKFFRVAEKQGAHIDDEAVLMRMFGIK